MSPELPDHFLQDFVECKQITIYHQRLNLQCEIDR